MIIIASLTIIFLSLALAVFIVVKNVPYVFLVPEDKIIGLDRQESIHSKIFLFLGSRQKIITTAIITKTIRRLKIVYLKADNMATNLLVKIQSNSNGEDRGDIA